MRTDRRARHDRVVMRSLPTALVLAAALAAAIPAAASADAISYVKDDAIYVTTPDGSRTVQVTHDGKFASPSQADDGTIVAIGDDNQLWRFRQDGSMPGPPVPTWLGRTGGSGFSGPYAARVSPDGGLVAFTFFHSQGVDVVSGTSDLQSGVSYSAADHATDEREYGLVKGWDNPAWIDSRHTIAFAPGATGGDEDDAVALHELGSADPAASDDLAHVYNWFTDPAAPAAQFGAVTRGGDRLAVGAGGFSTTETLRLYALPAPPLQATHDAPPQLRCSLEDDAHGYQSVAWSPDGSQLAYESGGSTYVVSVGDLSAGCSAVSAPRLLVAGGTSPSWSPATVAAPPAAGTATPGAGCTVPRLVGRRLPRTRRLVRRRGCRLRVAPRGHAHRRVVRRQSPKAGTRLPAGGRVTVRLG